MRQAQTLNEAQLRRVIKYTRSRRHQVRDETIILTSFYAGLRAKEIAALTVGNVFDEEGNVRTSSFYQRHRAKAGRHARCISTNAFVRHCWNTVLASASLTHSAHCLSAKKAGTSQPTPCVSCSWTFTKQWGSRMLKPFGKTHLHHAVGQQRRGGAACWQSWRGIHIYPLPRGIST